MCARSAARRPGPGSSARSPTSARERRPAGSQPNWPGCLQTERCTASSCRPRCPRVHQQRIWPRPLTRPRMSTARTPSRWLAHPRACRTFAPATAAAVVRLLDFHDVELAGRRAVVVGRSAVVGKPLAQLLLARDATVTICHSRTRDLAMRHRRGRGARRSLPGGRALSPPDMSRPGAVVIDVGTNASDGGIVGDVDARRRFGARSPIPRAWQRRSGYDRGAVARNRASGDHTAAAAVAPVAFPHAGSQIGVNCAGLL